MYMHLWQLDFQEYKPPCSQDIPEILNTTLYTSRMGPSGVLGSKATGEPCVLLAFSVMMAIRYAIDEGKRQLGKKVDFFQFGKEYSCILYRLLVYSTNYYDRQYDMKFKMFQFRLHFKLKIILILLYFSRLNAYVSFDCKIFHHYFCLAQL